MAQREARSVTGCFGPRPGRELGRRNCCPGKILFWGQERLLSVVTNLSLLDHGPGLHRRIYPQWRDPASLVQCWRCSPCQPSDVKIVGIRHWHRPRMYYDSARCLRYIFPPTGISCSRTLSVNAIFSSNASIRRLLSKPQCLYLFLP